MDICVITASNAQQAQAFEQLLEIRKQHGLYPREIDFRVIADPEGGRCGSGGSTLWVLLRLLQDAGKEDAEAFLAERRILIIHAGGESRRMPCYAPEGKLFAPVPVATSSLISPVVLDLQLGLFLRYPWKRGELVIASGDAVIDFDTEYLRSDRGDICGFAKPASIDQGTRHGVFVFDGQGERVVDFHQKADAAFLDEHARIRGTDQCALDIGIVAMSPTFATALASFARERLDNGDTVYEALESGRFFFDVYLDLLYACLPSISYADYERRIAKQSKLSDGIRHRFFDTFHPFTLHGALGRKAAFIHMGNLHEYPRSCIDLQNAHLTPFYSYAASLHGFEELQIQQQKERLSWNSVDVAFPQETHDPVIVEAVRNSTVTGASGDNVFVGLSDWHSNETIPKGICIDERQIDTTVLRLVYGLHDTFSKCATLADVVFCNRSLSQWLSERTLTPEDVGIGDESPDLLAARLFPGDVSEEFTAGYWRSPTDLAEWAATFRNAKRYSISEVNALTDVVQREKTRIALRRSQLRELIDNGRGWRSVSATDIRETYDTASDYAKLKEVVARTDDLLLANYRREHVRLFDTSEDADGIDPIPMVFSDSDSSSVPLSVAVKADQIIWARCPLRLDLAGGWSDTPPYTMRFGGKVVNLAVDLNGQPPVQVFCRRSNERHVRFNSIDLGVTETITDKAGLLDFRNPVSPFALPKAALCLLGLVGEHDEISLRQRLDQLGCGIEITLLCAVPKGSGLGTSSILGGTILGALSRFFGQYPLQDDLFLQVLELEQMLTTGGGWQDQIGGIVGGVKYIESRPELRPRPLIHQLDPFMFEDRAMHAHFTLYYTGVTRLAKNILQDVVKRVNEATPAYLFTHEHIKDLAVEAREAVDFRSLNGISRVLRSAWEAKRLVHPSATNDEVDELARLTARYQIGMTLPGAGGGGYALFLSPSRGDADSLREVLEQHSRNGCARITQFAINKRGLEISVS